MQPGNWKEFGWQGIELEVPGDWALGKIEGDRTRGYFRVDDEEMVRMEVKWDTPRSGRFNLDDEVDRHIRGLEKQARKSKQKIEIRRHVKLVQLPGRKWEVFHWKAEIPAFCLMSHCSECGRLLVLRVLYQAGEAGKELARTIFESVSDHREDCRDLWAVFGLSVRIPATFVLENSSMKTGEVRLGFAQARHRLEAVRVSLAAMQLRDSPLETWLERFYRKELEAFRWHAGRVDLDGHAGVLLEGKRRFPRRILSPFKAKSLKCVAWYCKDSDKLYILRAETPGSLLQSFEEIRQTMVCHR